MKQPVFFLAAVAWAAIVASSCASAPPAIPEEASAPTLVQRAQEAFDANKYDVALVYYQALKDRYGSDPTSLCAADYEIAHIAFKQGRFDDAKAGFEALLAMYAEAGSEALPPRYRILASKLLEEINAKQKTK